MRVAISTTGMTVMGDGSCCCGSGSGPPACDCSCAFAAGGLWTEYILNVAGLTTSLFSDCDCPSLNGEWVLKWRGGCLWTTDDLQPPSDCNDSAPVWSMICQDGSWLLFNPISITTFETTVVGGDFNTVDGGFMSPSFGVSPECTAIGATATLDPSGTFVPCP